MCGDITGWCSRNLSHQPLVSGCSYHFSTWVGPTSCRTSQRYIIVAHWCLTLWDPMDCSTPGFPVLHYLQEFAQTHVHWVSDAIQPFHSLSPASPPAFNLSQHQGLFQWVGSLHQVAKVLDFQLQHHSSFILPMNIQGWFSLAWTGWISLLSKGLSRVFSNTTLQKHQFFSTEPSLWSNSHIHTWLLEKTIVLTTWTFVDKVMSLLFNTLSRLVIVFLPRRKHLLISWLLSLSTVILESKQIKSVTVSIFSPSIYHEVMGLDAMILVFWMLSFKPAFHSPLSPSSRGSLYVSDSYVYPSRRN